MSSAVRLLPHRAAALLLVLCAALGAASAPPAEAAPKTCKPRAGTVYKSSHTRVWHERRTLFACTTMRMSGRPKTVRLGPWTSGGRAVSDGSYVAWTTKKNIDGTKVDRLWGASVKGPRFLSGARAIPASGPVPAQEGMVQRLLVTWYGAAWVTTTSDAVLAIGGYGASDPEPIGTLPALLQRSGSTVLVGSWPETPAATLAASAQLSYEMGETDDCGGGMSHRFAVTPNGSGPVGASWYGTAPVDPEICF